MKAIFESKKSPFYHFGYLMTLDRIPRLIKRGYIVKNGHYEFDDPFFRHWIIMKRSSV
uniref:Uncharacterized protein n=1 Tax=uncultured bacterium contig00111 TaxID=1181575 RepID=A0A806KPN7_9BACT|nr:hypothetical protein [uncultured bacterium contig00111]